MIEAVKSGKRYLLSNDETVYIPIGWGSDKYGMIYEGFSNTGKAYLFNKYGVNMFCGGVDIIAEVGE